MKQKIIAIAIILTIALISIFYNQKRNCELQLAQAKMEASDIGYQAGIQVGINQLNQAIINNLFQYGFLALNMPCDENGAINASGTYARQIILIPSTVENTTTTQ